MVCRDSRVSLCWQINLPCFRDIPPLFPSDSTTGWIRKPLIAANALEWLSRIPDAIFQDPRMKRTLNHNSRITQLSCRYRRRRISCFYYVRERHFSPDFRDYRARVHLSVISSGHLSLTPGKTGIKIAIIVAPFALCNELSYTKLHELQRIARDKRHPEK